MTYCQDIFSYQRRPTREVLIGDVGVGGDNPIRVQSMTISDTMNTDATVTEAIGLVEEGCEIVRITAPSLREAENLKNIKSQLLHRGVRVPLVADIHFTPNAALVAADHVEKVRINPGNYADKKRFEQREYSDVEYAQELERIEEKFAPLVLKCKRLGRALRIGTNHGSLSDRIMNRYGDTADGMVESALEFVRICRKHDYHDIILSMKSSNPLVAIQAYRLLAARMAELGMDYPFHLGVTEAGDGAEGRVKSAVGIGGLLEDGIGDTIRVSLTEDAVFEVPVAFKLVEKYNGRFAKTGAASLLGEGFTNGSVQRPNPFEYHRRDTLLFDQVYHKLGFGCTPRVELTLHADLNDLEAAALEISQMLGRVDDNPLRVTDGNGRERYRVETIHISLSSQTVARLRLLKRLLRERDLFVPLAIDVTRVCGHLTEAVRHADRLTCSVTRNSSRQDLEEILKQAQRHGKAVQWTLDAHDEKGQSSDGKRLSAAIDLLLELSEQEDFWNVIFAVSAPPESFSIVQAYRFLSGRLDALGANLPILLHFQWPPDTERSRLEAGSQLGSLLCDGIGDGIHFESDQSVAQQLDLAYNILQATRLRISKADYISCPSCGRTLFDLQTTTERIKSKTDHLKGVKIAIMGCIVNGPGEMADADFGYVGAGPQKVNLFVGKKCVELNIPEAIADERLIELIQAHGMWREPGG